LRVECPLYGEAGTRLEVSVRFLQLVERAGDGEMAGRWQEAIERNVSAGGQSIGDLRGTGLRRVFGYSADGPRPPDPDPGRDPNPGGARAESHPADAVHGELNVGVDEVRTGAYKLTVGVSNLTALDPGDTSRGGVLLRSLVSAHVVVRTVGGGLISLLDPPEAWRDIAATCTNLGVWPVLVGDEGSHDCVLASPIILYDYPQIAPESAGDLFDGTEIDEILALRILTLTEDEKREARGADARARQILDRTEGLQPEHWARLHGAVRGLRTVTGRTR
jgi:hypothetical protein